MATAGGSSLDRCLYQRQPLHPDIINAPEKSALAIHRETVRWAAGLTHCNCDPVDNRRSTDWFARRPRLCSTAVPQPAAPRSAC